jgi:hypothetical protein
MLTCRDSDAFRSSPRATAAARMLQWWWWWWFHTLTPRPRRYAGSPSPIYLCVFPYVQWTITFLTNLEPRQGLSWPSCLVFCSVAPMARDFKTSGTLLQSPVQPLGCCCLVQYLVLYLPYLIALLLAYLKCCWMRPQFSSVVLIADLWVVGSLPVHGLLSLGHRRYICHRLGSDVVCHTSPAKSGPCGVVWADMLSSVGAIRIFFEYELRAGFYWFGGDDLPL